MKFKRYIRNKRGHKQGGWFKHSKEHRNAALKGMRRSPKRLLKYGQPIHNVGIFEGFIDKEKKWALIHDNESGSYRPIAVTDPRIEEYARPDNWKAQMLKSQLAELRGVKLPSKLSLDKTVDRKDTRLENKKKSIEAQQSFMEKALALSRLGYKPSHTTSGGDDEYDERRHTKRGIRRSEKAIQLPFVKPDAKFPRYHYHSPTEPVRVLTPKQQELFNVARAMREKEFVQQRRAEGRETAMSRKQFTGRREKLEGTQGVQLEPMLPSILFSERTRHEPTATMRILSGEEADRILNPKRVERGHKKRVVRRHSIEPGHDMDMLFFNQIKDRTVSKAKHELGEFKRAESHAANDASKKITKLFKYW